MADILDTIDGALVDYSTFTGDAMRWVPPDDRTGNGLIRSEPWPVLLVVDEASLDLLRPFADAMAALGVGFRIVGDQARAVEAVLVQTAETLDRRYDGHPADPWQRALNARRSGTGAGPRLALATEQRRPRAARSAGRRGQRRR